MFHYGVVSLKKEKEGNRNIFYFQSVNYLKNLSLSHGALLWKINPFALKTI